MGVLAGSNASEDAQGEGEGGDEAGAVSGVDIVLNHQLVETGFGDKRLHRILEGLHEESPQILGRERSCRRNRRIQDKHQRGHERTYGQLKDLQFFSGESMDPDAMIAMCEYKDVDGNGVERPVFMFFKHGLEEEKV